MPNTRSRTDRDPVRWGILGTGRIARKFAQALRILPDARIQAVASRDRQRAEHLAREIGAERAHANYEELARDPSVDVVFVATPNAEHRNHCRLAIEHGKAVLCEKPFAIDASQGRETIALARERAVFCMEAMWMRFVPIMRELEDRLAAGAIGEVRMVIAHLGWPVRRDASRPLFDPALGGGVLLDLGVYPLSFTSRILGRPKRVVSHLKAGETGVDEQATLLLEYEDEKQAVITTSLRGLLPNDAVIVGTEGRIRVHDPLYCPERLSITRSTVRHAGTGSRGRLAVLARYTWVRRIRSMLSRERPTVVTRRTLGEGYAHEAIEVMRCLRAGKLESPLMPLDETLAILETIDDLRRRVGS